MSYRKKIGQPAKYKAVLPKEALPLLFKQKQEHISELRTKTQRLIEKFEKK